MGWLNNTLNSSLGKKVQMSLTGLFLIVFLLVHMSGNTLLFKNDGGLAFNAYSAFMTTNPIIKITSYILYASILLHIIVAIILFRTNKSARPVGYAVSAGNTNSSWSSRNMTMLGILILLFLILHLRGFWYEMHWGEIGMDQNGNKDLYTVVAAAYSQWWYVGVYVVSMIVLAFHLIHGFSSAFQTLGLNHKKYTPFIKTVGIAFSVIVPTVFAIMPIYMYLTL